MLTKIFHVSDNSKDKGIRTQPQMTKISEYIKDD